ncbi:DUF4262 domain-containing protein [Nocardioides zeae]|uniref:DUF4262 domain-containing protein n=1 Tax=Nocardioides imazamoxiresistens TaxID=3231893 RepID=A0ABU3Q2S7_9ACTN|nr:DUF4262 domain-containing protein [Nocardioides zeae]MDT9595380.1 DUF4262 domain-containing protein [Nocardioides zeae]
MTDRSLPRALQRVAQAGPWFPMAFLGLLAQFALAARANGGTDMPDWAPWIGRSVATLSPAILVCCLLGLWLSIRWQVAYRRSPAGNVDLRAVPWRDRHVLVHRDVHLTHVPGDASRPPYTYTVGLSARHHPELVVTGADLRTAGAMLGDMVDRVARRKLAVRQSAVAVKAWTGRPLAVLELAEPERWVPVADRLHGRGVGGPPVRAFQLVPVDEQGRWPWDVHPGTPGAHAAPDLTGLPVLTLR